MRKVQLLILTYLVNLLSLTAIAQDVSFDNLGMTSGEEKIGQGGSRDQIMQPRKTRETNH